MRGHYGAQAPGAEWTRQTIQAGQRQLRLAVGLAARFRNALCEQRPSGDVAYCYQSRPGRKASTCGLGTTYRVDLIRSTWKTSGHSATYKYCEPRPPPTFHALLVEA